jgi:hypothetical protein
MSNQLLVEGEVVFDEMGSSFTNATAYIRLEDTSRADAASRIVAEQVIQMLLIKLVPQTSCKSASMGKRLMKKQPIRSASILMSIETNTSVKVTTSICKVTLC